MMRELSNLSQYLIHIITRVCVFLWVYWSLFIPLARKKLKDTPHTYLPTTLIQLKKPQILPSVPQFAACPDTPCLAMSVLGPKLAAGNFARRPCLLICHFWKHLTFPWCLYETTIAILLGWRGLRRGRLSSLNSLA